MKKITYTKKDLKIIASKSYSGTKNIFLSISENKGMSYVSWTLDCWEAEALIKVLQRRLKLHEKEGDYVPKKKK